MKDKKVKLSLNAKNIIMTYFLKVFPIYLKGEGSDIINIVWRQPLISLGHFCIITDQPR